MTNSALTTGSGAAPAFTLGRYQLENAVSEIAAQLIWLGESVKLSPFDDEFKSPQLVYLAGHTDAGFQPAYGTSEVTDSIVQLQLNVSDSSEDQIMSLTVSADQHHPCTFLPL